MEQTENSFSQTTKQQDSQQQLFLCFKGMRHIHTVCSIRCFFSQPVLEETTCDVTTVILCGHTHSQTSILEHSLHNCLSRLRCVLSDGCAVRGGGWVEGEMAGIIRNTKTRKSVRDIFTRKLQLFTIFLLTLLGKVILNTVCEIVVVCVNFPNYCTPTHFAHMPEPWIYSVLHADWLAGVRAGILRQLQQR